MKQEILFMGFREAVEGYIKQHFHLKEQTDRSQCGSSNIHLGFLAKKPSEPRKVNNVSDIILFPANQDLAFDTSNVAFVFPLYTNRLEDNKAGLDFLLSMTPWANQKYETLLDLRWHWLDPQDFQKRFQCPKKQNCENNTD